MSVMSFVTSFVGAFVTSAVVARPKPDPKDKLIHELKSDIDELRLRNECLLHTLVRERDERIELMHHVADAEQQRDIWRARAEQLMSDSALAIYPPIQPLPAVSPAQIQLLAQQQQAQVCARQIEQLMRPVDLTPEMVERARVTIVDSHAGRDPGHWAACTCVPGRADMFRPR